VTELMIFKGMIRGLSTLHVTPNNQFESLGYGLLEANMVSMFEKRSADLSRFLKKPKVQ